MITSALAAILGALVGGLTSLATTLDTNIKVEITPKSLKCERPRDVDGDTYRWVADALASTTRANILSMIFL